MEGRRDGGGREGEREGELVGGGCEKERGTLQYTKNAIAI